MPFYPLDESWLKCLAEKSGVDIVLGYDCCKQLGMFQDPDKGEKHVQSNRKHRHELKGPESFESNEFFTFSNHGQTVTHTAHKPVVPRGLLKDKLVSCFDNCVSSKRLDFVRNEEDNVYYFEVRVDRVPSESAFIGVSASNVRQLAAYRRIPSIVAWDIKWGQLSNSEYPFASSKPPAVGETVGILVDFKSPEHNGCIRLFHDQSELTGQGGGPLVRGLLSKRFIWEAIPPISLYVGAYHKCEFGFTIIQFPSIPRSYSYLFRRFYTERRKIENAIQLVGQARHSEFKVKLRNALQVFVEFLDEAQFYMQHERLLCRGVAILSGVAPYRYHRQIIKVLDTKEECLSTNAVHDALWLVADGFDVVDMERICIVYLVMLLHLAPIESSLFLKGALLHVDTCLVNEEYQLGIRVSSKLFEEDADYQTMVDCWSKTRCGYCWEVKKLATCKGCMKIAYCSRWCQKAHWKEDHRFDCDQTWNLPFLYQIVCNILDQF